MADDGAPDCTRCGACCFSGLPSYVRVTGDDHARMGEVAEAATTWVGTRCYLRMERGRCASLRITDASFTCAIYPVRPAVCRALEPGSPECVAERHAKSSRASAASRESVPAR